MASLTEQDLVGIWETLPNYGPSSAVCLRYHLPADNGAPYCERVNRITSQVYRTIRGLNTKDENNWERRIIVSWFLRDNQIFFVDQVGNEIVKRAVINILEGSISSDKTRMSIEILNTAVNGSNIRYDIVKLED